MRIERTGRVEKLTPRVVAFLLRGLRGIALDDVQSAEQERIDYECLGGLLAIELKTLEGDPSERTNNLVDALRDRPDYPTFYGSVPSEAVFRNMENPDLLRRDLVSRIGRPIIRHLKKAHSQLTAHEIAFPRQNRVRALVLINEDHPEYDPNTVGFVVNRALQQAVDGHPRYERIDAVLYMTERHAKPIEGLLAFPTLSIHGPGMMASPWKEDVLCYVIERWAKWNDQPMLTDRGRPNDFVAMEHIHEKMPRHEAWRVAYRRNPHMKGLSNGQLRDSFDEVMVLSTLFGLKDSPMKLGQEDFAAVMQRFTHIQIEMHERALPMESFSHQAHRQLAAAARLGLPSHVLEWLRARNESLGHS